MVSPLNITGSGRIILSLGGSFM